MTDKTTEQKQFKNSCNCGGYLELSDRENLHLPWCFQYDEWEQWRRTIEQSEAAKG